MSYFFYRCPINKLAKNLFVFIFLLSCCSCDKMDNDRINMSLKGKVKSLRECSFDVIDRFGRIEKVIKEQNGILSENNCRNIIFNFSGYIVNESSFNDYKSDNNPEDIRMFTYNEKGVMIKEVKYYKGTLTDSIIYIYNEKGYKIIEKHYRGIRNTLKPGYIRYKYDHDDKGRITKVYEENEQGEVTHITSYDKGMHVSESIYYLSDGSPKRKCSFEYDNRGNLIEEKWYEFDWYKDQIYSTVEYMMTYEYDKKNNLLVLNQHDDYEKKVYQQRVFKYDNRSNLVEETNTHLAQDFPPLKVNYEYEFDSKGNWITRIRFEDEIPKTLIEREIEYY